MANLLCTPLVSGCGQKLSRLYLGVPKEGCHGRYKPCRNDFVLKKVSKRFFFFMLPFANSFKIFKNVFTFLYVKANSKEIGEKILFPFFFRKILMSAFLLRFKANSTSLRCWEIPWDSKHMRQSVQRLSSIRSVFYCCVRGFFSQNTALFTG